MKYFTTFFKGKCSDYPKTEYDSLTNTCVDVNECDRWLKADGADKDLYTLYEEAIRAGDGTAAWSAIVGASPEVTVYDLNNILFETSATGSAGTHIIAKGVPNAQLCANADAQPSIGTNKFADGTGNDYNLKEWFERIKKTRLTNSVE